MGADGGEAGFVHLGDEEDRGENADSHCAVSDDFVLQKFIVHGGENDQTNAQYSKVADEGEQVAQVVELILSGETCTLRLREQVSDGTKLM